MSGPSPSRRRALVAALVPLVLASLSACGGGDQASTEPTSSTSAGSSGTPQESASAGATVATADFVDLLQAGFKNLTTAHESMEFDMGATGALSGAGDVDYSSSPPAMTFTMKGAMFGADGVEMRMVDGMMYMQMPGMDTGKFMKFDLSDPASPLGSLSTQLDPRTMFASFEQGIDSVTFVGREEVDGESLDHYSVVVDSAAMLKSLGQSVPSGAASSDKLNYEVWLDGDNRLHQMTVDLGGLGTMKMMLSDWGKDVTIKAPAPGDITQRPGSSS